MILESNFHNKRLFPEQTDFCTRGRARAHMLVFVFILVFTLVFVLVFVFVLLSVFLFVLVFVLVFALFPTLSARARFRNIN